MCGKTQRVIIVIPKSVTELTVGNATLPIRYTKLLQAMFTFEGATCKTDHFVGDSLSCQWSDHSEIAVRQL